MQRSGTHGDKSCVIPAIRYLYNPMHDRSRIGHLSDPVCKRPIMYADESHPLPHPHLPDFITT